MKKTLATAAALVTSAACAAGAPAATSAPKLSIKSVSVTEGSTSTAVFSVKLDRKARRDVVVKFATSDASAKAGSDYSRTRGFLTIPKGKLRGQIRVHIINDEIEEPTESFRLTLSHPHGATLAKAVARGTIFDDDVMPAG